MTNSSSAIRITRALISSWRKEEAVTLAQRLNKLGVAIVASGGTADAIGSAGISVERISDKTGFDNLLGGRVKTLHPAVHAPILANRDSVTDMEELKQFDLKGIDLVAVDLYPFPQDETVEMDKAIELIDIGGVALIRGAAKNYKHVVVLSRAEQFDEFGTYLEECEGSVDLARRQLLAAQAFGWTSKYDSMIAQRLTEESSDSRTLSISKASELRYGENSHQKAAFYTFDGVDRYGIGALKQLGGKQLSYINLLDIDIAVRLPREFDQPAATILKHTTPCGVGVGDSCLEAFKNAHSTDPQSAYGGIIGFNCELDVETAKALRKGFVEVVVAPSFSVEAVKELKRSKNLRIVEIADSPPQDEDDIRSLFGGILIQKFDNSFPELAELNVVTERKPSDVELAALRFGWISCRYVKSNAILLCDQNWTLGIGAGQMSRVDASHIAVWKAEQAGLSLDGAVAASDAFFPFRDGVDQLADAGIRAIIQPGGSIRDAEVIEAADERGIAMIFTGRRHFRH